VKRYREDKSVQDADTQATVRRIYESSTRPPEADRAG